MVSKNDRELLYRSLKKFNDIKIQNYVKKVVAVEVPDEIIEPPDEYTNVIKLGKLAVPSLISSLNTDDDLEYLAANMALAQITNKQFGNYADFHRIKKVDSEKKKVIAGQWNVWWQKNKDKSQIQWLADDLLTEDSLLKQCAVQKLGDFGDKYARDILRRALQDISIASYAAYSLGKLGDKYAIPYLIDLYLTDDMVNFRKQGVELLANITGETLGFDPNAPESVREESIQRWREWWEKNRDKYCQ